MRKSAPKASNPSDEGSPEHPPSPALECLGRVWVMQFESPARLSVVSEGSLYRWDPVAKLRP